MNVDLMKIMSYMPPADVAVRPYRATATIDRTDEAAHPPEPRRGRSDRSLRNRIDSGRDPGHPLLNSRGNRGRQPRRCPTAGSARADLFGRGRPRAGAALSAADRPCARQRHCAAQHGWRGHLPLPRATYKAGREAPAWFVRLMSPDSGWPIRFLLPGALS